MDVMEVWEEMRGMEAWLLPGEETEAAGRVKTEEKGTLMPPLSLKESSISCTVIPDITTASLRSSVPAPTSTFTSVSFPSPPDEATTTELDTSTTPPDGAATEAGDPDDIYFEMVSKLNLYT